MSKQWHTSWGALAPWPGVASWPDQQVSTSQDILFYNYSEYLSDLFSIFTVKIFRLRLEISTITADTFFQILRRFMLARSFSRVRMATVHPSLPISLAFAPSAQRIENASFPRWYTKAEVQTSQTLPHNPSWLLTRLTDIAGSAMYSKKYSEARGISLSHEKFSDCRCS